MQELMYAIKKALDLWSEDYGRLEDGDEFTLIFNNGVLVTSYKGNTVKFKFIGTTYSLKESIDIFPQE